LSFYTQPTYRERFHGNGKGPAYITPATWINAEDILDEVSAEAIWKAKVAEPVRSLFAGRLVPEKGVKVLLDAVEKLSARGVTGALHLMGEGRMTDEIMAAQRETPFELKYFSPLPYGPQFLNFLQQYHTCQA
jgi:glycosyltransferase involved in cell wall biosynthesis